MKRLFLLCMGTLIVFAVPAKADPGPSDEVVVIAGDCDDGVVAQVCGVEIRDDARDLAVDVRELAVVRVRMRSRRRIRRVRVVEMNPRKKRLRSCFAQPAERRVCDRACRPLRID